MKTVYEIMHGETMVARMDAQGRCRILHPQFMPYNLYLDEDAADVDSLVNNVMNFNYWCASRILTPLRQYEKEILSSIGLMQAVSDRERAQLALSYHCLTLTDIFWVRLEGEEITFSEINLYENHLENAFVDVSLRGRQMTVNGRGFVRDLSTDGCFPKAWVRTEDGFLLYKDGGRTAVEAEVLASRICQCFEVRQVVYREDCYAGEKVSVSEIMTSLERSIVSREAFEIYAANHEIDAQEFILELDGYSYYMMNIIDYLVGNTDRHWGNWGFLVDNRTNRPLYLHPLMDFNQSFREYDSMDGGICQTVRPRRFTQREAAMEAVREIGLNQKQEINEAWFAGREAEYQMLMSRLELLEK